MEMNTFTVMPMSQQFSLDAGETYTGSITIVNPIDATEDFAFKVDVAPYSVADGDYSADLATMNDRTKIIDWITISESSGTIKPNETKKIDFTITVPSNAPAGGQYGAITVSSDKAAANDNGFAVNNIFEVASIIYANVSGETVHQGSILENNVPSFTLSAPVELSALLDNQGNVHESAFFTLAVTNAITGETIFPQPDQDSYLSELIMPETTRYFTREVNNLPPVGIVKVNQTIYYNNDVSTVEKDLIICPIWFMLVVAVLICGIITSIVLGIRRHRRKKLAYR